MFISHDLGVVRDLCMARCTWASWSRSGAVEDRSTTGGASYTGLIDTIPNADPVVERPRSPRAWRANCRRLSTPRPAAGSAAARGVQEPRAEEPPLRPAAPTSPARPLPADRAAPPRRAGAGGAGAKGPSPRTRRKEHGATRARRARASGQPDPGEHGQGASASEGTVSTFSERNSARPGMRARRRASSPAPAPGVLRAGGWALRARASPCTRPVAAGRSAPRARASPRHHRSGAGAGGRVSRCPDPRRRHPLPAAAGRSGSRAVALALPIGSAGRWVTRGRRGGRSLAGWRSAPPG